MSGNSYSEESCPACGDSLTSISDCFFGHHSALDNFEEVKEYLLEFDLLCDYPPLLDDYDDKTVDDLPSEPRDGPYVRESLVCTETWCDSDTCNYSRRTYSPPQTLDGEWKPPASMRDLSEPADFNPDSDIIEEAERLLDEIDG